MNCSRITKSETPIILTHQWTDCTILGRHFERISVSAHVRDKYKIQMADLELAFFPGRTRRLFPQVRFHFIFQDEVMVSFDVKSLFTSVPVDQAKDAIREQLTKDNRQTAGTDMSIDTIMTLVDLCMISNFQFRNVHYALKDGLAMGSPSSPIMANLFMGKLEQAAISSFHTRPRIWFRYVDDIFAILKKHVVHEFLDHLNAQHASIQFTLEEENNKTLPFMDIRVERLGNGNLQTSVYRKPTHTGRYLNFDWNHPPSVKRSVVKSLISRTEYVSRNDGKEEEAHKITVDLLANNYPRNFIRQQEQRKQSQTHASHALN